MEIKQQNKVALVKEKLSETIDYKTYKNVVSELAKKGLSTSPEQTEANSNFTKLNDARMRRLDKTIKVPDEIAEKFENFSGNHTWLVITESWCGDAAQSIPAMNRLAELSEGIDLRLIYRDTHPDLMDVFLTNGVRSIPKLIVFDNTTDQILSEWGSRPSAATKLVNDYKAEHGVLTPEFKQDLQVWYNKDKGQSILQDLAELI
ncbi:MAG: thioredoxin family protein [Bacteroidia bacterium]|nr:thioredoxin family protein [Bacteroidia bacterium]NNJ82648.1 thioredoxin family protein [Flavobacteriaceae bacterium]NNK54321.1 thioredoxin family protein [Flavobacteriaceae bacterium]